jgi:hypothetical protein
MRRRELLWLAACAPLRAAARPLFNGKDLSGWTAHAHGLWTVEEGAIVGRFDRSRPGPGYLLTNDEFTDFRLELEFWVSQNGNSGVYVRQPLRKFGPRGDDRAAQRPADGHEIQIDYNDPRNMTGAVYNTHKPFKVLGGENRWNTMAVECRGQRVTVWVEGETVNVYEPLRSPRGAVGFQMHGQSMHDHIVRFRNIRIEEFSGAAR